VGELTADQRAQLTALRQAYAAELPEKVQMIARAAAAAGLHNWEADGVRQLHQLVHRLAGSAAIWGFIEVSRAANELEAIVLNAMEATPVGAEGLSSVLPRLVDELCNAVPAARHP
jgi:HPt (histidine-containing phosphotransfer) domain-containing protein